MVLISLDMLVKRIYNKVSMFSIKKCVFYIIIKLHKRIKHMENDINIDFADYQTILSHRGRVDGLVGSL